MYNAHDTTAQAVAMAYDNDTVSARLDAVIDRWTGSDRIAGLAMHVTRQGRLVYRREAGLADRERGRTVTGETVFRLASLTKTIVAATALALAEAGRLSLADAVSDWLPDFRPTTATGLRPRISLHHLMTHTSGLGYDFLDDGGSPYAAAGIDQGLGDGSISLEENLARLSALPLFFAPGTQWRYSMSIDVLGAVIERAADMPLPDAVARYVTRPLGMTDTSFAVPDATRLAAAYKDGPHGALRMSEQGDSVPLGGGFGAVPARAANASAWPSGGAGMYGTATDYLRFLEAVRTGGGPILGRRAAASIGRHAIDNLRAWTEGPGWGFGLGAAVLLDPAAADTPQSAGTWQWGGVYGNHWFVDPGQELTVVVLTNTSVAGMSGAFPEELCKALYAGIHSAAGR
ncbi:serine hydrolase domain-containing protein [Marinibaculum pumilum]|uniref:Serine hydrolase domain-containing protein n=1 Tax=Marinibaculum pumilum TaxID=1766165 RepID=A0ABV7KUY4_9PROT